MPDILGSYLRGSQVAQQKRAYDDERAREEEVRRILPRVLAGDQTLEQTLAGIDPDAYFQVQMAKRKAQVDAETFGQPVQAVGADGAPTFVQFGNRGTPRPVQGYAPPADQASTPADVATALWYSQATPEQRAAFDATKRALPNYVYKDVNGVPTQIDPRIMPSGRIPMSGGRGAAPPAPPAAPPVGASPPPPVGVGVSPAGAGGGRPLSTIESEAEARRRLAEAQAAGTEEGKAKGDKDARRPQVIDDGRYVLGLLSELRNHPGLDYAVGKSSVLPIAPGTDAANFRSRLDQIKGTQFLQAFKSLKGGGTITEVEGAKAEQAKARMDRAQTEEAFREAVQEFEGIVRGALFRLDPGAAGVPPAAVEFLRKNPRQKENFRKKYGFVPDGI